MTNHLSEGTRLLAERAREAVRNGALNHDLLNALADALLSAARREEELREALDKLRGRAANEPLEVDISDFSDEWCAGFLAGQVNALNVARSALPEEEGR